MSDFSDWVQQEIAERVSTTSIETYGSFLVKVDNAFSRDYVALVQGTSGQILVSQGAGALPTWNDLINGLDADTIANADTLVFYDDNGAHNNKITFANFEGTLDHNSLTNTHGAVDTVDINGLDADTIFTVDALIFYDSDGAHNNKITFSNFEGLLNHNNLISTHNLSTDIDHNGLQSTHDLTNDIDHNTITNAHNLTTDIDHNTITNTHNLTTDIDHNALTNNHNLTTDIDHNALTNTHNLNTDLDIFGLAAADISGGDSIPYYNAGFLANRRITFTTFESKVDHNNLKNTHNLTTDISHDTITNTHNLTTDIDHDSITSGTIADHDTSATGAELDTLTNNSIANALHRHSELVASDGSPDPALNANAVGDIGVGTVNQEVSFEVNGMIRMTGLGNIPTTGVGVEQLFVGGRGIVQAYNRDTTAYAQFELEGLPLKLNKASGGDIHLTEGGGNVVINKALGSGIKVDTAAPTFGFADLLGEVFARNTGSSKTTRTAWKGGTFGFLFQVGDNEEFEFHIPHDYVEGTPIFLHIHWGHNVTTVTGGTVTFGYEMTYAKGHGQSFFGNNAIGTIPSTTVTTTRYSHDIAEAQVSISGGSGTQIDTDLLEPDGVIKMTVGVNANNLTVGAPDIFIHYIDIHYQTTGIIGTKSKIPDFYV